jgi:hypothetical protein
MPWAGSAATRTACATPTIVLVTFTTNMHIFDGFNLVPLTTFMATVVTVTTVADTGTGLARVVNVPRLPARLPGSAMWVSVVAAR